MRIYVYAIAKDEAAFAGRWMASMAEADGVYVLDTGSSDGTARALEALGAHVTAERIEPWRFDTARNRSMELAPDDADILVCTDLDEVLLPGWRRALEAAWRPGCTTARYEYVWSFNADGSDGVKFWCAAGSGRSMQCWNTASPGCTAMCRGCGWSITRTRPRAGRDIWRCWS